MGEPASSAGPFPLVESASGTKPFPLVELVETPRDVFGPPPIGPDSSVGSPGFDKLNQRSVARRQRPGRPRRRLRQTPQRRMLGPRILQVATIVCMASSEQTIPEWHGPDGDPDSRALVSW
jgi:hypothetical protein